MKGDFSKKTFDAKKHYKDVNMQQGRVLLDTDWNEQNDITDHRIETETVDTLGTAAAPMHAAGFEIIPVDNAGNRVANATNGTNLMISAGRFYSDGILCENESTILYNLQPDFLSTALPSQPADAGTYMFYLDVWERHITTFEDDKIREVALNGADTTTRTKIVWQVKYKDVTPPVTSPPTPPATCLTDLPADVTGPTDAQRGKINAKTEAGTTGGPCGLTTTGGFKGLANQLYRVEIHKAGNRSTATFKWSRENAYIVTSWKAIENATELRVENPGRDEILGFKPGDWVELIGERTDLLVKPGVLVRLANVEGNIFTIDPSTINDPEGDPNNAITRVFAYTNPRIRRWDMKKETGGGLDRGEIRVNKDVWIELEDGVKVEFKTGDYVSGDYWLVPARTAEAGIEWPFTTPQLPVGIKHHFSKLAICTLSFAGNTPQWTRLSDCRPIFPPVTELISLYYVGGDGQQARPDEPLPQTLKVGVSNIGIVNEHRPVVGAKVKFEILASGVGALSVAGGIVTTNAEGIAECGLKLGAIPPNTNFSLQVKASLLDAAGNVMVNYLPVIFTAGFSDAANVSYTGGDCNNWGTTKPTTVAEALTALCSRESESVCCSVTVGKKGGEKGDYDTLEKAFEKLNGKTQICICLLPGEHVLTNEEYGHAKLETLKITGCAASIIWETNKGVILANKIILEGIRFVARPKVPNEAKVVVFSLVAEEVLVGHCVFEDEKARFKDTVGIWVGPMLPDPNRVMKGKTMLRWSKNKVGSKYALMLSSKTEGWITENDFDGDIGLQYDLEEFLQLQWFGIKDENREIIRKSLAKRRPDSKIDGKLYIQGNIVRSVKTNTRSKDIQNEEDILKNLLEGGKTIPLYKHLIASENIFTGTNPSEFAAELVTMISNQFQNTRPRTIVTYLLGLRGIVTGNMDFVYNDKGDGGIIDTLFGRKEAGLNLVEVI